MRIDGFWPARPQALKGMRGGRWLADAVITLAIAVALAACGGGDVGEQVAASLGVATIGAAGGTVTGSDGASVTVPVGAMKQGDSVTIAIAKDSTGAPPLPPSAVAAGAVYTVTPHGGNFDQLVEISIPVERPPQAGDGQLLLVTAEPGDTQWRVLSGASYFDGRMRAPVLHFSFFQTIRLVDQVMPMLVTKIDGANNVGGPGIPLLSALQNLPFLKVNEDSLCLGGCALPVNTLVAELSLPAAQPAAALLGITPTTTCRPVDLGHGAMSFRFRREGSQEFFPGVDHFAVVPRDPWPRFPGDGGALNFTIFTTIGRGPFPGFGAIHYYGNETPRIFGMYDANPPTQDQIDRFEFENNRNQTYPPPYQLPIGNVYALPPPGDNPSDNLYTWGGSVWWSATQNGSVRIDAAIMTTCGLLLEAVPLTFKLDAPPPRGFLTTSFFWLNSTEANGVAEGTDVTLQLARWSYDQHGWTSYDADVTSYRVDFSPDPTTVDWQPAAASAVTRRIFQFFDLLSSSNVEAAGVQLSLPAVQASQAGFYRVFYCETTGCFASEAYRLIVLRAPPTITAQPGGQTVQVGQSASFTVATTGAPLPALQWQKRSFLAAAFGFLAWTNIDGATGATYTTPPLTMADTATQYRAWASNALGGVASDIAMLTVVEQFLPPVIVAQPGNLNVTVGSTAVFAVTVSGPGPLSYQWRRNGVNITGANSTILTLSNVSTLNDGRYELVVTNSAGIVTSEPAVLVVTQGTPVALPPTIAAAPASITVAVGNTANFAVSVNGTGPYTYLWMKNGVQAPIPGGDTPSLSIASVSSADAGTYSVRVTNDVGTVVSAAATLTVSAGAATPVAPTISTQPATLVVMPGSAATLAIAASGSGPFVYQWFRNGTPVNGATDAVLHLSSVSMLDAGTYTVAVSNSAGSVGSSAAQLILVGAPTITAQPANVSVVEGGAATFAVTATGDALRYQWTRNQVAIASATTASYTTPALTLADSGAVYGVIVYNGAGLVFSQGAVLTVTPAAPAAKAWGSAALIETDNVGHATRAKIAMDASGNAIAVWEQADSTRTNIWANRYNATSQTWGLPTLIESDDAGDASGPQIAIFVNGDAVAVWYQDDGSSRYNIWANRYVAATNSWGTATLLETSTATAGSPQIAADGNGNALVVWSEYNGLGSIWAIRYTAGTGWDAAAQRIESGSTNSAGPAEIAVDANGDAVAVWTHFDGARNNIWANRYAIATHSWGTAELIETGNAGTAGMPYVAVDRNGNAVAAWPYFDGVRYDIRVNHYSASTNTWGVATPSLTATATGSGDAPRVAFDAAGNAIVVWAQTDAGRYSIWANRFTPAVGWGGAALIETDDAGDAAQPQIVLDATGNAIAVWYQFDGTQYNIVSNRFTAGAGWGTAAVLDAGVGTASRPHVAVNSIGNAMAVWDQHDGSRISIWASSFR